jgi:acetyl esterase/lipase
MVTESRMKRPLQFLSLFGAALALAGCTSVGQMAANGLAKLQGGYTMHTVTFGPAPINTADVYVPRTAANGTTIVFFYGGRWQWNKKEDFVFIGAALAKRGYTVVIPEYSHYPAVRFPTFVIDGATAVTWTIDNITQYGGSPENIHIMGHSSGGHIGALLVSDERYLQALGKDPRTIRSFVGLAGPYAFTPDEDDLIDIFGPPERYPQMQATTFIKGDEPPMLLLHGDRDESVKSINHERLAARINEKGGKVTVITYPALDHIDIVSGFTPLGTASTVVDDALAFIDGHARNQRAITDK